MKQLVTHFTFATAWVDNCVFRFGLAQGQPLWWKWEGNIHCPDAAVAEADGFGVIKNVEYT